MKVVKSVAVLTTALTGFASAAHSQESGAYINIGADFLNSEDFNSGLISGRIGYDFSKYFGIEGQAGFGVIDDKVDVANSQIGDVKIGIDTSFAGFGVVSFPMSDRVDWIGRLGYHTSKIGASASGVSVGSDGDGFAGGVAFQYMWDVKNGFRADYTYYDLNGKIEGQKWSSNANVFSIAYVRKF